MKIKDFPALPIARLLMVAAFFAATAFGQCRTRLDESTLNSLALHHTYSSIQAKPGQTIKLQLYRPICCGTYTLVSACVMWSLNYSTYAQINSQTGVLTIKTADQVYFYGDTSFIVTANIESGRRILSIPVYIYKPEDNPLIGEWTEGKRFSCSSGKEIPNFPNFPQPINAPITELIFRASGKMYVTRHPFETYKDYGANYIAEFQTRNIAFAIEYNNGRAFDVDGFGRFRIDVDGKLTLYKLSLGRFYDLDEPACRYEFQKTRDEPQ